MQPSGSAQRLAAVAVDEPLDGVVVVLARKAMRFEPLVGVVLDGTIQVPSGCRVAVERKGKRAASAIAR